jgi:hypothetical protein
MPHNRDLEYSLLSEKCYAIQKNPQQIYDSACFGASLPYRMRL